MKWSAMVILLKCVVVYPTLPYLTTDSHRLICLRYDSSPSLPVSPVERSHLISTTSLVQSNRSFQRKSLVSPDYLFLPATPFLFLPFSVLYSHRHPRWISVLNPIVALDHAGGRRISVQLTIFTPNLHFSISPCVWKATTALHRASM